MINIFTSKKDFLAIGTAKIKLAVGVKIYGIGSILLSIFLFFGITAFADSSIQGYWKSIDEETGKATGYWKLEVNDNNLLGYLVNYPNMTPDKVCTECKDESKDFFEKPITGTAWLNLSKNQDGIWEDGYIIDSRDGDKFEAKVWVEEGNLLIRGYIGFFFRTQIWLRADQTEAEQAIFNE